MEKKPITEIAGELWHQLGKDHKNPFLSKKCRIFAISATGFSRMLLEAPDVYVGLELVATKNLAQGELGLGVETCGWAAPMSEQKTKKAKKLNEMPPSEHPKRRRVRIVTCVAIDGEAGTALGFNDDPDADLLLDEGKAQGSLSDALWSAFTQLMSKRN